MTPGWTAALFALLALGIAGFAIALFGAARRLARQSLAITAQHAIGDAQRADLEAVRAQLGAAEAERSRARRDADTESRWRAEIAALLDAAIDTAPIGFAFLDNDLRFLRANAFAARLTNRTPEALVGRHVREVTTPANAQLIERALARVVREGAPVVNQRLSARMGGERNPRRELIVNFYPVRPAGAALAGVACVLLDVTERVALEEQLRQSQKLEAVGRLAGGVAHDFNNLLTVARTYCDLLIEEMPINDARRADLNEIRNATDRASVLSRRLLAFGRKQVFAPRAIDLNEIARSLHLMFTRTLPGAVTLRTQLATDLRSLVADGGQVEQVVMNLVLNAVDAMPDGGALTIVTANVDVPAAAPGASPELYVQLSVQDTGIGMDKATRDHIFEPFFTTKEPGKGTGLGLSTVYGIVEQHGGSIRIDSEPGRGTTFHVLLPCSPPGEPDGEAPPERAAGPAKLQRALTVMIVDDEVALVASLHRTLSSRGYTVLRALSGDDAVRVAAGHDGPLQAVITDLRMPGESGLDLIDRIATDRPEASILVMSGYASEEQRRLIEARRIPFLAKPFAVDDLVGALERLIADRGANVPPGVTREQATPGRP